MKEKMSATLMDSSYVDQIVPEMTRRGFKHISTIVVDQNRDGFPYHIMATEARSTTYLMHSPNYAFVVAVSYNEHVEEDSHRGHWNVTLFLQFKDYQTLLRENSHWLDGPENETHGDMPILGSTEFNLEHFRQTRGYSKDFYLALDFEIDVDVLEPEDIVTSVRNGYMTFVRFLAKTFDELDLVRIVPDYTFGGGYGSNQSRRLRDHFGKQLNVSHINRTIRTPRQAPSRHRMVV